MVFNRWKLFGLGITFIITLLCLQSCSSKSPLYFVEKAESNKTNLPTLFFLNFATESDDGKPWGAYCAQLLHYKIRYIPDEIIYIPDRDWLYRDFKRCNISNSRFTVLSLDSTVYYANAYGTDYLLDGKIIKQADQLIFDGILYQIENGKEKIYQSIRLTGAISNSTDFFKRFAIELYEKLNIPLSDAQYRYLDLNNTGTSDSFQSALVAFELPDSDNKRAVFQYQQIINNDPKFLFAYLDSAYRMKSYNPTGALNLLQRVDPSLGDNLSLRIYAIYLFDELEQWDDILRQKHAILQNNPHNLEALCYGIKSLSNKREYDRAEELANQIVALYPQSWISHNIYRYYAISRTNSYRKGRYYYRMNAEEKAGFRKYMDIALKETEAVMKLHPNNPTMLATAISVYKEQGYSDADIHALFSRATSINPYENSPYERLITYYRPGYSNQPELLRELLYEAGRINPDNPEFAAMIIKTHAWYAYHPDRKPGLDILQKDSHVYYNAIQTLVDEFQKNPDIQYYLWSTAEELYNVKFYQDAWTLYEILPDIPRGVKVPHEYYLHKAWTAYRINRMIPAVEYAEKCLAANPCENCGPYACLIKAQNLILEGKFDEGFGYYQKGIDMNPKIDLLYADYAYYAAQYNYRLQTGFDYIKKAIELKPDNARNWGILARLHLTDGNKQAALTNIDKAIQMDPSSDWYQQVKQKILALP